VNILSYETDQVGISTQDRIRGLLDLIRLATDVEVDARRQADEARDEIAKLELIQESSDDEL
jgi:hypothetical protein